MDEVLFSWAMLLVLFAWRWICKVQAVQTCIHRCARRTCPFFAWLVQWYTLLQIGLGLLIFRTFNDVVKYEYKGMLFLAPEKVEQQVNEIRMYPGGPPLDEAQRANLEIPAVLRWFSLGAPVAGLAAFIIVLAQTNVVARKGAALKRMDRSERPWRATKRQNMVMIVLCLPAVFIAMSMRSQIRVWSVMTGTSWANYIRHREHGSNATWEAVATSEVSTCDEDLALANFFQLQAIGAFGLLTISYLKDAPKKYRKILSSAGLLGLWCYMAISILIFLVDLYKSVLASFEKTVLFGDVGGIPPFIQGFLANTSWTSEDIQNNFLDPIQPMNLVFTLLCVANMLVYERMEEIEMHLGEATLKFNATKLLLILTHGQPIFIAHVTYVPFFSHHIFKYFEPGAMTPTYWHPSEAVQMLVHTSLLCYECLIVVIVNGICWGWTVKGMDHKFFGYFPEDKTEHLLDGKASFRVKPPAVECMLENGDWEEVIVAPVRGNDKVTALTLRPKRAARAVPSSTQSWVRRVFYDENDTDESEDEHGDLTKAHRNKEIKRTSFPQPKYPKANIVHNYPEEGLQPGQRTISTESWVSGEA